MFPTVQAVPLMDTWYEGGSQTPTRQSSRATLLTQNPSQAAVVFELSMWSILIGGTWYMKLWKVKHEPTLPNEASSTELEFQTVGSEPEKSGGKFGPVRHALQLQAR
jgi:hypothetical protein